MSDNTSLPSVQEVNDWSPDKVIAFLKFYNEEKKLYLRDEDIKKIENNWVPGPAFLNLTLEKLLASSLSLPYGPAEVIAELVSKIKGEGQ
ncbi:7525_t:CDS:1, partial [Ambispora gerdemannii]